MINDQNSHAGETGLELSEIALNVLRARYLKKNEAGEVIEEPIDMFRRVARTISNAEYTEFDGDPATGEEWYFKFLDLMLNRKFMPNSPTLMNAGRELGQLSACFVLPIEDNLESIYDTLKHQALIHQTGGGTGFSFSRLRPKGDIVKSSMGVASGPVSFLSVFDSSTEQIKQGSFRRGANMGILRVDHPDIFEFIDCKRDNDKINNFNISVAITDAFMQAVENDTDFDLTNPRDGEVARTVRARELWDKICGGAWLNGEPGIVFLDAMNRSNPTPQFSIESTNPCAEAILGPYDVCNLGSINLERFYAEDMPATEWKVAWNDLGDAVHTAVRFLDNVIEVNKYPLPEIAEMSKGNRRIGLGVMGFADLLIKLNIRYDSSEGFEFGRGLMEFVNHEARMASKTLAKERGNFPNWKGSVFGPVTSQTTGTPMRNATVTTIAPTGTISMIAGCSSGIEPLFAVAFKRRQADMEMNDVNPEFERRLKLLPIHDQMKQAVLDKVAEEGDLETFEGPLFVDMRKVFRTAGQISAEDHVRMQAAFQKHTSMGISKTINMDNSATVEDVKKAYELAYGLGCMSTAVYRDGSRDAQVLSTGKTGSKPGEAPDSPKAASTPAEPVEQAPAAPTLAEARNGRPRTLTGVTKKIQTGHGHLYVTMNDDEFGPRECFVTLGKVGGSASAFADALGRMITSAMTHGALPQEVVHQLRGIQDGHPAGFGPNAVLSVPDGIARAMAEHYMVEEGKAAPSAVATPCPECGAALAKQEGCVLCGSCGWSKCH